MADSIDELQIEISAKTEKATKAIDGLIKRLDGLSSAFSLVETGGFKNYSNGMMEVSNATKSINTRGINTLKNALGKLGRETQNLENVNFDKIGSSISSMSESLSKASGVSRGTVSLINSISRLGMAGQGLRSASSSMPAFSDSITRMISSLSKAPAIERGSVSVVSSISRIASAGNKAKTTADNLDLLADKTLNFIKTISKAPNVNANTTSILNSIGNIASAGGKANSVFRNITNGSRTSQKGLQNIGRTLDSVKSRFGFFNKESRNFAQIAGMFYAKAFLVIRGFKGIGKSIQAATDYIEEYNYFNTTLDKIAKENKGDYAKFGYKDAEEYADSFQERLKEKMSKMTGFNIGENGVLSMTNAKNLGLDITQMTNYSAGIAQLSDSIGLTGEQSIITSQALTMLAGDMSSFKNMDMEQVQQNFTSALSGSTMAIRKYGIDISVASLKQTALNLGITKSVQNMTQAEKVQLRTLTILEQSKVAWGDLAKTINSPSNQLRIFSNNLKSVSRMLGEILLPVMTKIMPYVNAFAVALQRLLAYIGSFIGIDLSGIIESSSDGFSDIADDVDDVSDGMDKATKSTKKFKNQLMGFDNLNVISSQSDKEKNSGTGSDPIDLTEQLKDAFSDYEKVWNKEYKKMQNKAQKFADKLTDIFKKAWKSGDGSDIGSSVAEWINKGIKWLENNGSIFDNGIKKIVSILSSAINGFVKKFDFTGFGKVVGDRLKALLEARNDFFKNTDWKKLGEGIAASLNGFVDSGAIQEYLKGFGTKLRAAIEFAFGTITTFDFGSLGDAIAQGINDAFGEMSAIDKKTGLTGWEMLGQTISDAIIGLEDTVIKFLDGIKWEEVGNAIADFIGNLDFVDIFSKATHIFVKIVKGFGTALIKAFEKEPLKLAELAIAINQFKFAKNVIGNFKSSICSLIGNSVDLGGKTIELKNVKYTFGKKGLLFDKSKISGSGMIAGALLGAEIGKSFCEFVMNYDFTWSEFFQGLKEWSADVTSGGEKYKNQLKKNAQISNDEVVNFGFATQEEAIKLMNRYGIKDSGELQEIWNKYYPKPEADAMGERQLAYMFYNGDKGTLQKAINDYKTKNSGSISNDVSDRVLEMQVKLKLQKEERQRFREKIAEWSNSKLNAYSGLKLHKDALKSYKDAITRGMKDYAVNIKATAEIALKADKIRTEQGGGSMTLNTPNGQITVPVLGFTKKASGGIFKAGKWHDIAKYGIGGTPDVGQLFIAREKGPELVGSMGGGTAVMNNDQIVSSVARGVSDAVARTLAPYMSGRNGNNGDVIVQIDGENVFRAVRKQNDGFKKRNGGQSALA